MMLSEFVSATFLRFTLSKEQTKHQYKAARYLNMWQSGWHLGWRHVVPAKYR